jgi:hypothetical protein
MGELGSARTVLAPLRIGGIGRPFYAEPDLARRILGGSPAPGLCQCSNLCVPAQMLGTKGACYDPAVTKARRRADQEPAG